MKTPGILAPLLVAALAIGFAYSGLNDFYLLILFNIGVYYIAATGFNVLVGQTGQNRWAMRACSAWAPRRC